MSEPNKKPLIFIIDDDSFLLNMYSIKFRDSDYEVVTALDGSSALSKLREGLKPHIIMLDMVMPAMDGIEVLTQIRKEKYAPEAKIVILSNQSQSEDIQKAKELGVQGYIVKATTIPSEVVTEVNKILGK